MSKIRIQGGASGVGVITIVSPATATNRTLTLPDESGTLLATSVTASQISDVTSTATELNYVDGVTSAIQTQIDAKVDDGQVLTNVPSGALFTDTNTDTKWDGGATGLTASTGRTSLGLAIGTDVQAYDADTTKNDVANTFTADQTFTALTETKTTKSASFTPNLSTDGTLYSCSGTMTITMPTAEAGKSFTIIHATATSITWSGTIKWGGGAAPTAGSAIDIYTFVSDGTNWYGMQAGTGFA